MHFYGALMEQAPHRSTLVDPRHKVNVEMIHSSPFTKQSVIQGRVFEGIADDQAEGPNSNAERVPSPEPPCAQPLEESPAHVPAVIELW